MAAKKTPTIPVPAEAVYKMAEKQLATSRLHREALEANIGELEKTLAEKRAHLARVDEDITALEAFLAKGEEVEGK